MATFAIVHGAGDSGASWELVAERLQALGHLVVAPDLPCEDDAAGFGDYADTVADAVEAAWRRAGIAGGGSGDPVGRIGAEPVPEGGAGRAADDQLVVVAHSLGGFTAARLSARLSVDLFVLVSAMVPLPGESGSAWWEATGHPTAFDAARAAGGWDDDERSIFWHDLPEPLVARAVALSRGQSATPMAEPFPLPAWPAVPTRFLLCRDDRCFPAAWMRPIVRERLGIEPDEIDGGHAVYLSRPAQLAARLDTFRAELAAPPPLG